MLTSFHCEGVGSNGSIPDSTSFGKYETLFVMKA